MLERCDRELKFLSMSLLHRRWLGGFGAHLFSYQKLVCIFMLNKRILQETGVREAKTEHRRCEELWLRESFVEEWIIVQLPILIAPPNFYETAIIKAPDKVS